MSKKYYITILIALLFLMTFSFIHGQSSEENKNKPFKWKMVTTWPKDFPIFQTSAKKFAEDVRTITKGQLDIEVYADGEYKNIKALDVFDAVSNGKEVQMGHSTSSYWNKLVKANNDNKVPGCEFFSTIPFGLNAEGMYAWIYQGGGLELWRELYAPYNIIPFPVGNTGPAMGGWFKEEIENINSFKDIKIRIAGLGGKVYKKAGAVPISCAPKEIQEKFENGEFKAAVFQGAYHDQILNLDKCKAKYYYYPGWQEPGAVLELIINKQAWDDLPKHLKESIKSVAGKSYNEIYTQFERLNFESLKRMKEQGEVVLKRFPSTVIEEFRKFTNEILEEEANRNQKFNKIYEAYQKFEDSNKQWKIFKGNSDENSYNPMDVLILKNKLKSDELKGVIEIKEQDNRVIISLESDVLFESEEPKVYLVNKIGSIVEIIKEYESIKSILVEEHTYYYQKKKKKWKNLKLSMKRAEAIKKLLIDKGADASLIKLTPFGDSAGDTKRENKIEIIIEF